MSLQAESSKPERRPTKLWVPFVLALGVLLGIALSYFIPVPYGFGPFGQLMDALRNLLLLHMVFSTVVITLQVALVAVYSRVYIATKARFALGILAVMTSLLVQSLFQYPLFLAFVGRYAVGFGPYLSSGDIFTIVGYAIFLYLSLE